jgi:hypothetical protein
VATKKRGRKHKPISEKQRAEDDKLRESLRYIDLTKFDKALEKAIVLSPESPRQRQRKSH